MISGWATPRILNGTDCLDCCQSDFRPHYGTELVLVAWWVTFWNILRDGVVLLNLMIFPAAFDMVSF